MLRVVLHEADELLFPGLCLVVLRIVVVVVDHKGNDQGRCVMVVVRCHTEPQRNLLCLGHALTIIIILIIMEICTAPILWLKVLNKQNTHITYLEMENVIHNLTKAKT